MLIGRVIRAHGVDGSLRIQPHTDNPRRFQPGSVVLIQGSPRTVASCRPFRDGHALLRLENLDRPDDARQLAGEWLVAPVDADAELPPGEYYHYQLVGLTVITDEGERLGAISEVLVTGSNDVYVVRSETGGELLLPAITQVVQEVDLAAGTVLVHLLDGLR